MAVSIKHYIEHAWHHARRNSIMLLILQERVG